MPRPESTSPTAPETNNNGITLIDRARKFGAVMLSAGIAVVGSSEMAQAKSVTSTDKTPMTAPAQPMIGEAISEVFGVPNAHTDKPPRTIDKLPGMETSVKEVLKKALTDATGKQLRRRRGTNGPFEKPCSFVRYKDIYGNKYGFTAAHCFGEETGAEAGVNYRGINRPLGVFDYINNGLYEYAVTDSEPGPNKKPTGVDGLTIKEGEDFALMRLVDRQSPNRSNSSKLIDTSQLSLDTKIPVKTHLAFKKPRPQQAYAVGLPASNGGEKKVGSDGFYLGRVEIVDYGIKNKFDVVAFKDDEIRAPRMDSAWWGGSGGGVVLADGSLLGPLARRFNSGYPNGITAEKDSPGGMKNISFLLRRKGIDIEGQGVVTLGLYTVMSKEVINSTLQCYGKSPPDRPEIPIILQ